MEKNTRESQKNRLLPRREMFHGDTQRRKEEKEDVELQRLSDKTQ